MAQIRKLARKGGREVFEARIHRRSHGKPLSKCFGTEREAREWANMVEHQIDRHKTVSRSSEIITFGEACADFLQHYRPRNKSGSITENEQQLTAYVNQVLGRRRVRAITRDTLQEFIDEMLKARVSEPEKKKKSHPLYNGDKPRTYSESTVRKHYYQIKKILIWHSTREKYSLEENLFQNHAIPKSWAGKRNRRLEAGELDRLEAAAMDGYEHHEEWKLLIRFALATAGRSQEILKARWSDVNIPGRAWNIPPEHVKTSTFRQVPLSKVALSVLKQMQKRRKDDEARIFWMWRDSATISKGFRRLTARAKIKNLRFHDLRHEAVSRIFETTDLTDSEIMSITGHTNVQTLVGYAHLRASFLASKLDGLVSPRRMAALAQP